MKKLKLTLCLIGLSVFSWAQTEWIEVPVNTDKQLNAVDFPSAEVGYIGGNDSLLLKTTDGGESWTAIDLSSMISSSYKSNVVNLKFVSEDTGYMTFGIIDRTYLTVDGGDSWNIVETSTTKAYDHGLFFFGYSDGFIGGTYVGGGEVIDGIGKTEVLGEIVTTVSSEALLPSETGDGSIEDLIVDIDFYDENYGLAVSDAGVIYRTTDGGDIWNKVESFEGGYPLTSVEIVSEEVAYVGYDAETSGWGVLKTEDGGENWEMDAETATWGYPAYLAAHESEVGDLYIGGRMYSGGGIILEWSEDSGWLFQLKKHGIRSMDHAVGDQMWGVGDSGFVVKSAPVDLGVEKADMEDGMGLMVYPNPANDKIMLQYSLGNSVVEEFHLTIYDLKGQTVFVSTKPQKEIDVSNFDSGIYCIRLTVNEAVSVSRFSKQ